MSIRWSPPLRWTPMLLTRIFTVLPINRDVPRGAQRQSNDNFPVSALTHQDESRKAYYEVELYIFNYQLSIVLPQPIYRIKGFLITVNFKIEFTAF